MVAACIRLVRDRNSERQRICFMGNSDENLSRGWEGALFASLYPKTAPEPRENREKRSCVWTRQFSPPAAPRAIVTCPVRPGTGIAGMTERIHRMATGYSAGKIVAHNMVTTQFELDGFHVTRTLGVVRGIVVRSRSIFGTIGASLQTLVGGNITLLTNLCEKTRQEAFDLMLQHAAELGGNAVVGARYDATEVMQGVTEVLAYGTAVFVEPSKS